ncbi:senescence-associated protein-domain-containing protein [Lophiotrema nucula]|uniref:Senescence-associated protein-domain-containing protein n=1 Tax=Lophiotrema nucula TaxID=690887 RepID=A0A6A5YY96_9PLEO|nr:senescence-associated protein-domain-containing protein [Lophiotrema nucula]
MSHSDPRLLYSIGGIKAYHIQQGEETSLTPSGPQTLSLLMVPTNSPFADLSNTRGQNEAPEEDFYLHLNLPPELDLPLPATTQIYHQPPRSYLIPRWDLGPDSGAFTRIEFPAIGKGPNSVNQEDIDTFETILAQCTAFLERAQAPSHSKGGAKPYNPADYAPGEGYVGSGKQGEIVLIDEENGSVVGELAEGAMIVEDPAIKPGSKSALHRIFPLDSTNTSLDPVEINVSADGKRIDIKPMQDDYLSLARHPAYKDSSLVQNAAAASRLIVTGSSYLSNMMVSGAEGFMTKTKPAEKPMVFKPATHDHVRKINTLTTGVAGFSAKTVGQVTKYAQNIGAGVAGRKAKNPKHLNPDGTPNNAYKPGLLNKSMIAFSTVADGIAHSGKTLLTHGGAAASAAVGHKYGPEAGSIASDLAGGVKNVGLVYIDVTGVSRRAVIKSVAKGMVVGRVKGGGEVVVGGGDGGVINPTDFQPGEKNNNVPPTQTAGPAGQIGFGNTGPPAYHSGVGESIEGQAAYYPPEKR